MTEPSVTEIVEHLHKTLGLPKSRQDIEMLRVARTHSITLLANFMGRLAGLPCSFQVEVEDVKDASTRQRSFVAQVIIPANLPCFLDPSLAQVTIKIIVKKRFLQFACFEALVIALAHEVSHVLLNVTRSSLMTSERATDVCAMMLGYEHIAPDSLLYATYEERDVAPWWKRLLGKREFATVRRNYSIGYLTVDECFIAIEDIAYIRALRSVTART